MILTDLDAVNFCLQLYASTDGWDLFWPESQFGLTTALRVVEARDVVVHRGSETPLDWWDDFRSELAEHDPDVGDVPAGFYQGLRPFHEATRSIIRPGPLLVGHSLGAARAVAHGALLAAAGNPPIAVVVFGCPRPGTQKMNALFTQTAVRWYRNGAGLDADPVTDVPVPIPGLLPWIHCGVMKAVDEKPAPDDPWGPLRMHHAQLYAAGVAKLSPVPSIG